MSYASWSVVANEQPSASKWNILGTNDASFNDGTGIASLAWNVTALSNPYKFSAYRNAAWTGSNGAFTKVAFDTELFDTNSNFDSVTNNRYVAPVAGFYFFSAGVNEAITTGNYLIAALYKNGVQNIVGTQYIVSASVDGLATVSGLIQLAASDYVEVYGWGSGGAGRTGQNATYFHGFLMCRT